MRTHSLRRVTGPSFVSFTTAIGPAGIALLAGLWLSACGGGVTVTPGDGAGGGGDMAVQGGGDGMIVVDMTPRPASCMNGAKDGDETDLDCGGSCLGCATGKACGKAGDCASGVCTGGVCAAPSCSDAIKNGDETDVDCGGACPKCAGGKGCVMATDCVTNVCNAGRCGAGPITFGPPASYPFLNSAWGIVAVDLNKDGKPDVAVNARDGVEVFLNKGDGTFGAAAAYGAPMMNSVPGELAAADFNKDGNVDLVWPDFNFNLVYVTLGKGDGTFPAATQIKVTGGPQTVTTGDFDGDGRADVALGLAIGDAVAVMTGNGNGTFGMPVNYPSGSKNANCVGVMDLDGDGKQDIVVGNTNADWRTGNSLGMGSVYSLTNMGNGTFKPAVKLFDAGEPTVMAVLDLNADAKLDFAFSDYTKMAMVVSLAGGAPTSNATSAKPIGLVAADLNFDGKAEIAVTTGQSARISVFPGNGDGSFAASIPVQMPYPNPGRMAAADFNGDGKPDFAVVNYNANGGMMQPTLVVVLNTTM